MFGDLILVICRGVICLVDCSLLFVEALYVWWPVHFYLLTCFMFGGLLLVIGRGVMCLVACSLLFGGAFYVW